MKITRQEKLKTYLTPEKRRQFKMSAEGELLVFDEKKQDFLPYLFTKAQRKKGVEYFRNDNLQKDVYLFLVGNFNNENITMAEVRGIIKLIPYEL